MRYKGVVFDKDGTLIDFHETWLPVYRFSALAVSNNDQQLADELLSQHGYDLETDRITGGSLLAAGNNREIGIAWSKQLPRIESEAQIEAICTRLDHLFQQQGALHSTPVNGLQTTLRELKQAGLKLGVATSDSYQGILSTLQSFDVISTFDFLCGYDSGHGVKPDPGMVMAFCDEFSLEPAEVIVVGDNRHDIEMGKNADAGLCVGVLTGASTRGELEEIADIVLDDISGLGGLVLHQI